MRMKTLMTAVVSAGHLALPGTALADLNDSPFGPGPESTNGCGYPLLTDDTGDGVIDESGVGLGKPTKAGPADMDITSTNLSWTGGKLVADIGLANADMTMMTPPDSTGGNYWYVFFTTADGTVHFVKATNTAVGLTYSYGEIGHVKAPNGTGLFDAYTTDGSTTGSMVQGPNGHILIDVPTSLNITPGTHLTEVFGNADAIFGYDDNAGFNNHIDEAPDGVDTLNAGGATLTVTDCSQPGV